MPTQVLYIYNPNPSPTLNIEWFDRW